MRGALAFLVFITTGSPPGTLTTCGRRISMRSKYRGPRHWYLHSMPHRFHR
jgi:hypothetical protein